MNQCVLVYIQSTCIYLCPSANRICTEVTGFVWSTTIIEEVPVEVEVATGGTDGSIKFGVILKIINKGNITSNAKL